MFNRCETEARSNRRLPPLFSAGSFGPSRTRHPRASPSAEHQTNRVIPAKERIGGFPGASVSEICDRQPQRKRRRSVWFAAGRGSYFFGGSCPSVRIHRTEAKHEERPSKKPRRTFCPSLFTVSARATACERSCRQRLPHRLASHSRGALVVIVVLFVRVLFGVGCLHANAKDGRSTRHGTRNGPRRARTNQGLAAAVGAF